MVPRTQCSVDETKNLSTPLLNPVLHDNPWSTKNKDNPLKTDRHLQPIRTSSCKVDADDDTPTKRLFSQDLLLKETRLPPWCAKRKKNSKRTNLSQSSAHVYVGLQRNSGPSTCPRRLGCGASSTCACRCCFERRVAPSREAPDVTILADM